MTEWVSTQTYLEAEQTERYKQEKYLTESDQWWIKPSGRDSMNWNFQTGETQTIRIDRLTDWLTTWLTDRLIGKYKN